MSTSRCLLRSAGTCVTLRAPGTARTSTRCGNRGELRPGEVIAEKAGPVRCVLDQAFACDKIVAPRVDCEDVSGSIGASQTAHRVSRVRRPCSAPRRVSGVSPCGVLELFAGKCRLISVAADLRLRVAQPFDTQIHPNLGLLDRDIQILCVVGTGREKAGMFSSLLPARPGVGEAGTGLRPRRTRPEWPAGWCAS